MSVRQPYPVSSSASGDVVGPASSTDNAIVRFNGTDGKAIQDSGITIDDTTNLLTTPGDIKLTESDTGSTAQVHVDSEGFAELTVDRGGTSLGRQALVTFRTAGTTQFNLGLLGSTDTLSVSDESNNSLLQIADGGSVGNVTVTGTLTSNGTLSMPTPFTLGGVSVTPTGTELNYVDGVTSAIQTQIDTKAPTASPTFTGTVVLPTTTLGGVATLSENSSIALDPAGSADGKYTGITVSGTAGTALAFGDLIYLAAADSRWELADADAASTSGDVMLGMCVLAAAADGDPTTVLLHGIIRADAAFPALTISAQVYVSTTAGDIQVAQPSGVDDVIRVVGRAITADEIYFHPSEDYLTHV